MKGAQVFPTWIPTAKAKLGDARGRAVSSAEETVREGDGKGDNDALSKDQSFLKAPRMIYKGHQMAVRCVGYLVVPNSEKSLVFSAGDGKAVFVWSLKTGAKVAEFQGHTQRITSLATYNRPGCDPLLISASWDERLRIWPLQDVVEEHTGSTILDLSEKVMAKCTVLKGHTNRVFSLAVVDRLGEPAFLVSGSSDNTIRTWSLPEGTPMYVLEDDEDVTWNLCVSSWHMKEATSVLQQGSLILAGCKNNTVRVWNHRYNWTELQHSAAEIATHPQASLKAALGAITGGAAKAAGSSIGHAAPDMVICGHSSAVHSVVPFEYQDEPLLATACKDFDIRIFSITTGELKKCLRGHKNFIAQLSVRDVSNARGGAILVSASWGGNMRVWKYSTGECLRFFKGHTGDVNAVEVFPSPNTRSDDLVLISASRDTTVRTWLFAEEKALKVLDHGHRVKIRAMDVHHAEAGSLVVTGADDGGLRAWRTKRNEGEEEAAALEWKVSRAHSHQVLVVAIYTPLVDLDGYFAEKVNTHWPAYLSGPLVLSASRNGYVRVCSLKDGAEVTPAFRAHDKAITSLHACSGARRTLLRKSLDPFLVSGSEDNTVKIWSMIDFTLLRVLEGHEFDVTSVTAYMPKPPIKHWDAAAANRGSNPGSRLHTPRTGSVRTTTGAAAAESPSAASLGDDAAGEPAECDPIVISGSMDQTVRLWRYTSGECLKVQSNSDSHITCVACLDIEKGPQTKHAGPVAIAGDGYGVIWVWSLALPYSLLFRLQSHTDEVRSVFAYDAEGVHPVLVSGSLDCTVKVWNLETMKLIKTIEGHTADVTEVQVFNLGGSDLALVSASLDTTVRVVYDFMEAAPQQDLVKQLFEFDLNGTNAHVTADESSAFPRIAQLSRKEGADQFFGTYHFLFADALRRGRPEFLEEFLGQSVIGLLRANDADGENGSLLRVALDRRDLKAIRCIVDCWCRFYTDAPAEYIHDETLGRLSMSDLLQLAQTVPLEFQKLICSIKPIAVKGNTPPPGAYFLYERDSDKAVLMSRTPLPSEGKPVKNKLGRAKKLLDAATAAVLPLGVASTSAEYGQVALQAVDGQGQADQEDALSDHQYLYLPLTGAVHMDMLYALTTTCEELDSVEIFNSEVGRLALAYAWRRMGLQVHLKKMAIYLAYIILSTTSLLTFESNKPKPGTGWISYVLIIAQLALDGYFVKEEGLQLGVNPIEYLSDIWNAMDFVVVVTNALANILRLAYGTDNAATRVLLCICSIVGYFNILYFLRAFEETGPLVSMILKISNDMKYLILVVMVVLVGFSQAFWILSEQQDVSPFGSIEAALLNSFVFMLGGYDPTAFDGIYLVRFAIALSAIYMLIVSILLLNLLIALMGDSYGSVKEKGLAQWKLEQAQIITEMQGSMNEQDRTCTDIVYLRTQHSEPEAIQEDGAAKLEAVVADLKQAQKGMMKMLLEQQERMRQQMELNTVLKEFLAKNA